MSVITVPRVLRDKLGDEGADAFVDIINKIDSDYRKDLATKADLLLLEAKVRLYFILLAVLIILTNPKAIELFGKLLGLVK